jgi:E3 ubiquitin-protein ligase RNF168
MRAASASSSKKSMQENIDPNANTQTSHKLNHHTRNSHHKLNLTPTRSHSYLLDSPMGGLNNKSLTKLQHSASDSNLNLSLNDCTCPICLEILVEPVKMPCSHELCLPCFKAMTDKTNFLCPMCRMRISTWSRSAANTNTLVDETRWAQIKAAFPREVRIRLEGKTAIYLEKEMREQQQVLNNKFTKTQEAKCAAPGEIGKEYKEYLRREEERIRLEKENEEKLSSQLIQQVIVSFEAVLYNFSLIVFYKICRVL